jgi:hypothetical protein
LVNRSIDALWDEAIQLLQQIEGSQEPDEVRHRGGLPILDSLQGETSHPRLFGEGSLADVARKPKIAKAASQLFEDGFIRI